MSLLDDNRFRENAIVRNATPERLDERAQLTTPREWAVLACLGLVMAAIIAWGVVGSVERTLRLDGALILADEARAALSGGPGGAIAFADTDAGRLEAVAFVAPDDTRRLETGMAARLMVEPTGGARPLPAELTDISPRVPNPPDWLTRRLPTPAAIGPGHTVRFTLTDPPASGPPPGGVAEEALSDGMPCRIEIVLERVSPFALLMGR